MPDIKYTDDEYKSDSYIFIRKFDFVIGLSVSIQKNGDIDTVFSFEKAEKIANALYEAINAPVPDGNLSMEIASLYYVNKTTKQNHMLLFKDVAIR